MRNVLIPVVLAAWSFFSQAQVALKPGAAHAGGTYLVNQSLGVSFVTPKDWAGLFQDPKGDGARAAASNRPYITNAYVCHWYACAREACAGSVAPVPHAARAAHAAFRMRTRR